MIGVILGILAYGIIAVVLGLIIYGIIYNESNGDGPSNNDYIGW